MTENSWVNGNVQLMFDYVVNNFSDRKIRLIASYLWSTLVHNNIYSDYINGIEEFADGNVTSKEVSDSCKNLVSETWYLLKSSATESLSIIIGLHFSSSSIRTKADCIKEIIQNPFCKEEIKEFWLNKTVLSVANQIYNNREFDSTPILADALFDAGCTNLNLMSHLREKNHVRGCWALDLILKKE